MKKLFKNWPEICKIGEFNKFFMVTMASLDFSEIEDDSRISFIGECELRELKKRNNRRSFAISIAEALPEFFSDIPIRESFPFSILIAKLDATGEGNKYINSTTDVCEEFEIPFIELGYMPDAHNAIKEGWIAGEVPEEWFEDERFTNSLKKIDTETHGVKEIFEWNGEKFVLIGNCSEDSIVLIPLECLNLDL